MSIVSVDNIQPIGSGTSVTVNSAATLVLNNVNSTGVVTASSFSGSSSGLTGIANANIASDAAIAGTKISPNFGSQNITSGAITTIGAINIENNDPTIYFTEGNSNPDYKVMLDGGVFTINDVTNSADRFRIKSSGEVEIGTVETDYDRGASSIKAANDGGGTAINVYLQELSGSEGYGLGVDADGDLNFYNSGATSSTLEIKDDNNVAITNGNLIIGTSGKGIDFHNYGSGATISNNLLDDYEEGSWTPEVRIETRPASDSPIDSVQGNYIKVGGLVHAFGQFTLNGTPSERSTSRAIEIRNFPFTHNHNFDKVGGDVRSSGHLINSTYGSDIYFVMRMLNGANYCRLEIIEQGYAGTRNASPVMTDNMNVIFAFTFSAA